MTTPSLKNEKPNERIKFAIEALKEFMQLDNTVVHMRVFHNTIKRDSSDKTVCFACLGGAAALKKYGIINDRNAIDSTRAMADFAIENGFGSELEIDHDARLRLFISEANVYENSLDAARLGDVESMFSLMGFAKNRSDIEAGFNLSRLMPEFDEENPEEFFCALETLAKDLEKAGF